MSVEDTLSQSALSIAAQLQLESWAAEFSESWDGVLDTSAEHPNAIQFIKSVDAGQLTDPLFDLLMETELDIRLRASQDLSEKCVANAIVQRYEDQVNETKAQALQDLEFEMRTLSFDNPDVEAFLIWSEQEGSRTDIKRLQAILGRIMPVFCKTRRDGSSSMGLEPLLDCDFLVAPPFFVGRQDSQRAEPAPPQLVTTKKGDKKLVLAPAEVRFVSREQVLIERVATGRLKITNRGRLTVIVNRERELRTGKSVKTEDNVFVEFFEYTMQIAPRT